MVAKSPKHALVKLMRLAQAAQAADVSSRRSSTTHAWLVRPIRPEGKAGAILREKTGRQIRLIAASTAAGTPARHPRDISRQVALGSRRTKFRAFLKFSDKARRSMIYSGILCSLRDSLALKSVSSQKVVGVQVFLLTFF